MSSPRFLIIRGGAIGDFILTVPVFAAIRERWSNAHIEVLGYPHIAELAIAPELVNAVRSISVRGMATFFAEGADLDREFRDYFGRFQQIISFLYDPDQIFEGNIKRITKRYLTGPHKAIDPQPPVHAIHASSQLIRALESLAIYIENPVPHLYPQLADRLHAHDFFQGAAPKPLVAVHPGSGGESKVWPVANWAEFCRWLIGSRNAQVLIVGGEADVANVQKLRSLLAPASTMLASGLKLTQVGAIIEQATLFVGHDSGISHLAAAVGVPSLVLFGPTNPAVWRPLGEKVRILHGATEWTPQTDMSFFAKPMDAITLSLVQKTAESMLAQ
jgi:heptosyltransferase-2